MQTSQGLQYSNQQYDSPGIACVPVEDGLGLRLTFLFSEPLSYICDSQY